MKYATRSSQRNAKDSAGSKIIAGLDDMQLPAQMNKNQKINTKTQKSKATAPTMEGADHSGMIPTTENTEGPGHIAQYNLAKRPRGDEEIGQRLEPPAKKCSKKVQPGNTAPTYAGKPIPPRDPLPARSACVIKPGHPNLKRTRRSSSEVTRAKEEQAAMIAEKKRKAENELRLLALMELQHELEDEVDIETRVESIFDIEPASSSPSTTYWNDHVQSDTNTNGDGGLDTDHGGEAGVANDPFVEEGASVVSSVEDAPVSPKTLLNEKKITYFVCRQYR